MELASYETITEILPIEGADRIEIARVQGWQSVIKKGEYKVGDGVIFVPIDTVLQPRVWNEFLWDKNDPTKPIRVKTVKLRGTVSQGLIFPRSLISAQEIWDHSDDPEEDTSIAGMLGITKYEKPIPANLRGEVAGNFPTQFISRTDEDNLLSNIKVLEELKASAFVRVTLKMDGTSVTYIKDHEGNFKVCSRNLELRETPDSVYWQMAKKYQIESYLPLGTAVQGEICGPGIQGNPAGLQQLSFFHFNVKDLSTGVYKEAQDVMKSDFSHMCLSVPFVESFTASEIPNLTLEKLQTLANEMTYVKNGKPAEGIVIRGYNLNGDLRYSETLNKMLSVKIINQNYKD